MQEIPRMTEMYREYLGKIFDRIEEMDNEINILLQLIDNARAVHILVSGGVELLLSPWLSACGTFSHRRGRFSGSGIRFEIQSGQRTSLYSFLDRVHEKKSYFSSAR